VNFVSKRLPILDGAEKVTGALKFAGDLEFSGILYAKLVLSPRAHARVVSVDTRSAAAVPGVAAIFWRANTPRHRYNSSIWAVGQSAEEDETMFPDIVRHIGDRVAAVIAESQEIAELAARLIEVAYEDLPAVVDPRAALYERADAGDLKNPIAEVSFSIGDVDRAFSEAAVSVTTRVSTPKSHHAAIETHVAIAALEAGGRVAIYAPCQSVFAVQAVVAKALGILPARIRAIKTPIGGSFGGKAEPILEPLCAYFALQLQRPVKIALDRRETFLGTRSRSGVVATIRTGLDREGRILARETTALIDVGAYCTGGHYLPGSMAQRLSRLYDIANKRYFGQAVMTNTPPTGAFRGYGTPQINAITEINLDLAARALGMDPVRLRLKNVVKPGAREPYQGLDVGNARIRECLTLGARAFGWTRRRRAAAQSRGRKAIGVGMAAATHINGCYPAEDDITTASMVLKPDGRVQLVLALHDLGSGSLTTLLQIAAETTGVPPTGFDLTPTDSDLCPYDLGTRASRMTYVCGEAVRQTAEGFKQALVRAAARWMNCAPDEVAIENGELRRLWGGSDAITLANVALALVALAEPLPSAKHAYSATANPGSYAAHFAEVEVDRLTGRVGVKAYLAAHDVGRSINPMLVEGQIHGGVQIGIGFALFEDVGINATGVMRGDRFSRYHLANAPEMPRIQTLLIEKGEPTGPYGAKAVGEIATVPVAAAVVNAVNHALGSDLADLPLTPEKICAWLDERERFGA
jgi:CO/xanthine dehydrogenase Mo-binding subunit